MNPSGHPLIINEILLTFVNKLIIITDLADGGDNFIKWKSNEEPKLALWLAPHES